MKIEENYSLREYNTFAIDVRCKYFVSSDRERDFMELASTYELLPEKILILGGGSNFLFTEDFDGTVLYPRMSGIEKINEDEERVWVRVGSGETWDDFVAWTVEHGYGGVENLSLIPGHVGASPVQNVGAYGMEVKDTISDVEAIDLEHGHKVTIGAEQCEFGYRDSRFKHDWKNRFLITYVVFELYRKPEFKLEYGSIRSELEKAGGEISLKTIREAVIRIRNSKLPDVKEFPNAGSFFKNPVVLREFAGQLQKDHPGMPFYDVDETHVKLAAGWLIEQAGWKGKSVGNAAVHDKQALVLINKGNAAGVEVAQLANEIKKSVFMQFSVWIEPEVYII